MTILFLTLSLIPSCWEKKENLTSPLFSVRKKIFVFSPVHEETQNCRGKKKNSISGKNQIQLFSGFQPSRKKSWWTFFRNLISNPKNNVLQFEFEIQQKFFFLLFFLCSKPTIIWLPIPFYTLCFTALLSLFLFFSSTQTDHNFPIFPLNTLCFTTFLSLFLFFFLYTNRP